jgi:ABC-2 type transport system permease protein
MLVQTASALSEPAVRANPFFYFINGVRQSMLGFSEVPGVVGYVFTMIVAVVMFLWVLRLYSKGYGLRE